MFFEQSAFRYFFRCIMLLTGFLFVVSIVFAQDVRFSQFYANPLSLNPALAGSGYCPRFQLSYRNHIPSHQGAYVSYMASYDQHFRALHGGIGVQVFKDEQGGLLSYTGFNFQYAYLWRITPRLHASMALQVSYMQRRIAWDDLIWGDMLDGNGEVSSMTAESQMPDLQHYVDFGSGIVLYGSRFYLGACAFHLLEPSALLTGDPYDRLWRKYTFHGGYRINVLQRGHRYPRFTITPNVIFRWQQISKEINYGFYLARKLLVVGVWGRHDLELQTESLVGLLGFKFRTLRLGYSYDFNLSEYRPQTIGVHEISLGWKLDCRSKCKRQGREYLDYPGFY